ncbi:MAG: hypothetical protein KBD07_03580 [Candidatus Omnitrophica bacterium]|jgi:hypothetical protein|nr:hypothetical protein [Candidatus Omnitrophota bacterium]
MSIFGCIGKGFATAKASGSLILALFGFSFVWALINLPFTSPDSATQPSPVIFVLGVLFLLINIFIQGGSIGYVEQVTKQGASSLGVFAESGKKNYLRMLVLGLVLGLIMIVLAVLAMMGFLVGGPQAEPNPLAIVVAVVVAIVGALLLLFLFLAPYAVVVDQKGAFSALKTSVAFVRQNFLKVLLVGLVLVVIGFAVGFVLGLITGLLAGVVPGRVGQAIAAFLTSGVNSALGVVTTGAFMALYLSGPSTNTPEAIPAAN